MIAVYQDNLGKSQSKHHIILKSACQIDTANSMQNNHEDICKKKTCSPLPGSTNNSSDSNNIIMNYNSFGTDEVNSNIIKILQENIISPTRTNSNSGRDALSICNSNQATSRKRISLRQKFFELSTTPPSSLSPSLPAAPKKTNQRRMVSLSSRRRNFDDELDSVRCLL